MIKLRGTTVPVLALRRRCNLADTEYTKETVVIIVRDTNRDGAGRSLGLVVDAVSDVLFAQDDDIASTPDFGAGVPTENILGLHNDDGHMAMLLDVGSLLESETASDADME